MGMAATQARYLALIARQNDLEYQGQQINQERTVLSQQVTDLYNTLQNMTVPTPPSTTDFTTIEYSGSSGATSYTFDTNNIKPGSNGKYSITLGTKGYAQTITANNGYSTVKREDGSANSITGTVYTRKTYTYDKDTETTETVGLGTYNTTKGSATPDLWLVAYEPTGSGEDGALTFDDVQDLYVCVDGHYEKATHENFEKEGITFFKEAKEGDAGAFGVTENTTSKTVTHKAGEEILLTEKDIEDFYVIENGTCRKATISDFDPAQSDKSKFVMREGLLYLKKGAGEENYKLKGAEANSVGGGSVYTLEKALENNQITQDQYDGYINAIKNAGLLNTQGKEYGPEDFYIIINNNTNPATISFALINEVNNENTDMVMTYSYEPLGEYTKYEAKDGCDINFDPSSGRITSISVPNYVNGELVSYTKIDVEAKSVTDELAYQDAFNKYEYDKYLYDKEQQAINAKTEVIQQEDKKLELKLQRLDNERTQITTEIEALEKVINDNIEASYKTFSG